MRGVEEVLMWFGLDSAICLQSGVELIRIERKDSLTRGGWWRCGCLPETDMDMDPDAFYRLIEFQSIIITKIIIETVKYSITQYEIISLKLGKRKAQEKPVKTALCR